MSLDMDDFDFGFEPKAEHEPEQRPRFRTIFDYDVEIHDWISDLEKEVREASALGYTDEETQRKFSKAAKDLNRIESLLGSYQDAYDRSEEYNPRFAIGVDYYSALKSVLEYQMYRLSPVDLLNRYHFKDKDGNVLFDYDLATNVERFNASRIYEEKFAEQEDEITQLQNQLADITLDDEHRAEINEKLESSYKKHQYILDQFQYTRENMQIDVTPFLYPMVSVQQMAELHEAYMASLSEELKENQDRQIEIAALRSNGIEEGYEESEPRQLRREFYLIQQEKADARNWIKKCIPHDIELAEDFEEYELKQASGEEIFERMTDKQKLTAKKSVFVIANGGKKPGFFRKRALHLSKKNIDELIKDYINTGELDIEEVTGKTKEAWTVEIEGEKKAQEMFDGPAEEFDEEFASGRDGGEEEPAPRGGEGEEEPASRGDEGEEEPAPSRGEGEDGPASSRGEGDDGHDVRTPEEIEADLYANFEKLSPDARVDIIAQLYDIHEQAKEVLKMFASLSPEAQQSVYDQMSQEHDMSREK